MCVLRSSLGLPAALGLAVVIALSSSATAHEPPVLFDGMPPFAWYESSTGADATRASYTLYSSATVTLWRDVRTDGMRLRIGGGYGAYSYASPRWVSPTARAVLNFDGRQAFSDVMLGYHASVGPWLAKIYIGGTYERHDITPFDQENSVQGAKLGVKAALETWLRIGDTGFLQTDTSWSPVFSGYNARARLGWRLSPAFSVGPEVAVMGNATYDAGRAGAFLRYEWDGGEVSFSAGASGDRSEISGPYGSVGFMLRY